MLTRSPLRQLLDDLRQARTPAPRQTESTQSVGSPSVDVSDVNKYYERGEAFLKYGQYHEAAAVYKRVIKADPDFADAHYGLGVAYLEMGALDDAKAAAEEASKLKANRQLVHELLTKIKVAERSLRRRRLWKKGLSYAIVLGIIAVVAFLVFKPDPPIPPSDPKLSIAASLEEPSGNGFLDAGEKARLRLIISNKGGTARNVELRFEPPSIAGLRFRKPTIIPELRENKMETIRIPITADKKVKGRDQVLAIQLFGENKTLLTTKTFSFKIIPATPDPIPPGRR